MKGSGEFELPSDSWYHLAPLGEFPHESAVTQIIDARSVAAMASAFAPGHELLIDFDHESWNSDKRTTAAGWILNLISRDDGLWAQIRWSKAGVEAVSGGEYRFISPVWAAADCESDGPGRVRPMRLSDAGLTNRPNLRGLTPLANRESGQVGGPSTIEAADAFLNTVRDIQTTRNLPFERAWESAIAERPNQYAALLQNSARLANAAVVDAEPSKYAAFRAPENNPYLIFDQLVRAHAAEKNLGYERSFDAVKLTHPDLYRQIKGSEAEFRDPRHQHTTP